jgi:pyrophosphatase PpaX
VQLRHRAIVGGERVASISRVRFETVLFDLDGTVIDSGTMILASFRHATQTVLRREIPDEELVAAVGGTTLPEQMERLDPDRADELVRVYREHNGPLHQDLETCAGMLDVLDTLRLEGRNLGIVTSKRRASIELAFDVLPLRDYFAAVVATEDTQRHKPEPDPILLVLDRLGATADGAAYVGDAPFDVQAAKAAGVAAVAVTWGGIHSRERLERERPDALVDTTEELLAAL